MSWVGGDIPGLQHMGFAMKSAKDKTDGVVRTLGQKVDDLANDADWEGEAAGAYRKYWTATSIQVGAVNSVVSEAGGAVEQLGNTLQRYEAALYDAADEYRTKGASIGPNGEPQAVVVQGDPSKSPAKEALEASRQYKEIYDYTIELAKRARTDTATSLLDLMEKVQPPDDRSSITVSPDKWATAIDYLRGLYLIPDAQLQKADDLAKALTDARQRFKDTRGPLKAAKAEYAAKGLKLPSTSDPALAHSKALKELNSAADEFGRFKAPGGTFPGSTWLDVKIGELPGAGGLTKALPKGLEFLKEIPVLDIAAAVGIGALQAQDDQDKGWGASQSYLTNIGAGLVGVGAGVAIVAALPEAAGAAAIAAETVGVGATVVWVGNVANAAFHEHWAEDIHDHGVVGGIATGVKDSVVDGSKETWELGKSVWHGIFG